MFNHKLSKKTKMFEQRNYNPHQEADEQAMKELIEKGINADTDEEADIYAKAANVAKGILEEGNKHSLAPGESNPTSSANTEAAEHPYVDVQVEEYDGEHYS